MQGIAGFFFEFTHQVVFADVMPGGQGVYGQIFTQVVIDVFKDIGDLWIIAVGFFIEDVLLLQEDAV